MGRCQCRVRRLDRRDGVILSHSEIQELVQRELVQFSPSLDKGQIGEASVDLRLGFGVTRLRGNKSLTISVAEGLDLPEGLWEDQKDQERYELKPGEFVLAMTHESVSLPTNIIGRVEGRSTYARVGLSMHQTAPWIQPGWQGHITLEIMNNGPWKISLQPLKDRPCQLTLFKLTEVPENVAYGSRKTDSYQNQAHPLKKPL